MAFDGKCLRVGQEPCCWNCQPQRQGKDQPRFLHRVRRVIGSLWAPPVFLGQKTLGAHKNEIGAFRGWFEGATFEPACPSLENAAQGDE